MTKCEYYGRIKKFKHHYTLGKEEVKEINRDH